ncbi:hypothetical protein AVEN_177788-1 [Araneus ventricosus]|uniref:Uncharacterized protein n=1 Tax=Araneus ventricosus TaxID=182803 RepID=A0A4Y2WX69_ARAVE|nr:hypothetical protein AVEN_177788-1 [Araneus ventricosus]
MKNPRMYCCTGAYLSRWHFFLPPAEVHIYVSPLVAPHHKGKMLSIVHFSHALGTFELTSSPSCGDIGSVKAFRPLSLVSVSSQFHRRLPDLLAPLSR